MLRIFATVCLLLLALPAPAETRLYYRYRNDAGQTVLDYQVPAEALQRGYQVIDAYGRVVRNVPPPKTPEELAALKREEAARSEQERLARQRAAADRRLLQTYSREADLLKARDTNLTAIDDQMRLSQLEREHLKAQLGRQTAHAAQLERSGEAVPPSLLRDIENSRQQVESRTRFIAEREQQRRELEGQFEQDLTRYRALLALPEAERRALLNQPPPEPPKGRR